MQVSGSPAQLRHCRQLFPLKHGKWTRGFTSISGSIYAENCRTIFAHMCCDCGHEQACLLIAPTRADDCALAEGGKYDTQEWWQLRAGESGIDVRLSRQAYP